MADSLPPRHEFAGRLVVGDHCLRCDMIVAWIHIPDSLASACKECGFVRVSDLDGGYTAGATVEEWLRDTYGAAQDPTVPGPKE